MHQFESADPVDIVDKGEFVFQSNEVEAKYIVTILKALLLLTR